MSDTAPLCFYCATLTVPLAEFVPGLHDADAMRTRDHVFPRWLVARVLPRPSLAFLSRNTVCCCAGCNTAKGGMHPLLWADRLSEPAAIRLRELVSSLASVADSLPGPSIRPPGINRARWSIYLTGFQQARIGLGASLE